MSIWAFDEFVNNGFYIISKKGSPVICIDIGWANQACRFFRYTFHNNLALVMIGYPASDLLKLTLRVCICSYHTKEDIGFLISVLKKNPDKKIQEQINQMELSQLSYSEFDNLDQIIIKYGIGSSGPHAFYGNLNICVNVEKMISNMFDKENSLITQHSSCGIKNVLDYIRSIDSEYVYWEVNKTNWEFNANIILEPEKNYCINLSYLIALQYVSKSKFNWKIFNKFKYIVIDLNSTFVHIIELLGLTNNNSRK